MDTFSLLWRAPKINPINQKAQSIPFLNPVSTTYGRTFFFSWFGFMIAFWSWYGTLLSFAFDYLHEVFSHSYPAPPPPQNKQTNTHRTVNHTN